MVYIPGFLVNKVYERGSLKNTKDGFSFCFKNTMTPLKISGMRDIKIKVNEVMYTAENIQIFLGKEPINISSQPSGKLISFSKNSLLFIHVKGENLPEGKNVIKISFITNEFGGVSLKVKDTIGEVEKLSLGQKLKRLFSKKKKGPLLKPLSIKGSLGGIPLDPDFSRLEAILRLDEPDRVPLFEAEVEIPIQEWFLGREVNTAEDEVEFYIRAGYDYVPIVPPFFTPRLMRAAKGD